MADPWVEVVRPIWPEVVDIWRGIWTEDLDILTQKIMLAFPEDLQIAKFLLKGLFQEAGDNSICRNYFLECVLVLASVGGESSFHAFLDCIGSSLPVGALLGSELKKMWEAWKKKASKKPKRASHSRWRHDILSSEHFLNLLGTFQTEAFQQYANRLNHLSMISSSDFEKVKAAVRSDDLSNIRDLFHRTVLAASESARGFFLSDLRVCLPKDVQSIEKVAGIGVSLKLKHVKELMEKVKALAQLERYSVTDQDRLLVSQIQRTLLEKADVTKPLKKTNLVREAARSAVKSVENPDASLLRSQGLSPEARKSYDSALQGGERKVPHIRALFCGPGRVGKTCLGRSMLGQKFTSQVDSTVGVELQKIVCTVLHEKKTRTWKWRAEKDEDEQQLLLAKKVLKDEVKERAEAAAAHKATLAMPEEETPEPAALGEPRSTMDHDLGTCLTVTDKSSTSSSSLGLKASGQELVRDQSADRQPSDPTRQANELASPTGSTTTIFEDHAIDQGSTREANMAEFRIRHSSESEEKTNLQEEAALHVKCFLKNIHKLPAKFDSDLEDEMCFVDLWDFAGQDSFVAVQHMLLSELRCAYAVVFDASLKLDEEAPSTFCKDGTEQPIEGASIFTNFDVVESWLNTIHQAVGDTDAPVYAIGCKVDRIPADEREARKEYICDYIWRNAEDKAYKNNINDIIFVDNTVSGTAKQDSSIRFLRQDLIEKMKDQLEMPIPLRWLPFTVAVRQLARKKEMPWLSMDQVSEVAHEVCKADTPCVPLDVTSLLQFHHHLGHILYYAQNQHLNDRVIIDVEWLLKIVSLLFVPQVVRHQEKRFRRHYDLLRTKGILLESLAQHIWKKHGGRTTKFTQLRDQRDYLFHLMEEFSLLFNTGQVHAIGNSIPSRKFYIPALVSHVDDNQLEKAPSEESPPVYLFSGTTLLFPQTLFWCLVVRCMKHFQSDHDPIVYRNSARILCDEVFWLVLTYFQHGIKLVVEYEQQTAPLAASVSVLRGKGDLQETCHAILMFAEKQLEELKGDALQHIIIQCAAHCDCSLNRHQCRKHSATFCKKTECRHFVELVEGKVPRCPLGLKPAQDVQAVAQCWLFPPSVQSAVSTSSDTAQAKPSENQPAQAAEEASSNAQENLQEPELLAVPEHFSTDLDACEMHKPVPVHEQQLKLTEGDHEDNSAVIAEKLTTAPSGDVQTHLDRQHVVEQPSAQGEPAKEVVDMEVTVPECKEVPVDALFEVASKMTSQAECAKLAGKLGFKATDLLRWKSSKESVEDIAQDILLRWSTEMIGTRKGTQSALVYALSGINRPDLIEIFNKKCKEWQ